MKQTKINTKPLSGFMELKPAEQIQFNKIMKTVQNTYELYGFVPIDTPILERAEVLLAKGGEDTDKQIYRFTKGNTDLGMRFDLTVPLARYVAEYQNDLVFPFRRYAIGKVYRGEKAQAGRFREFYQCDADIIGKGNLDIKFDAEIPLIISTLFKQLGFENFTIKVNNRKILNGFFQSLGLIENQSQILRVLDKFDKIGKENVINDLRNLKIKERRINNLLGFLEIKDNVIFQLRNLNIENNDFQEGINELEIVTDIVRNADISEKNCKIDLSIARGLAYYTGTVYETVLNDYPELGSVCGGGRYNDLTSYYTENMYQGVGFTFGLTRLFYLFSRAGLIKTDIATTTKVTVICNSKTEDYALNITKKLRNEGINTEILYSLRDGLSYSNKLGIPYVILIGDDEVRRNQLTLKDMKKNTQESLDINNLIKRLNY